MIRDFSSSTNAFSYDANKNETRYHHCVKRREYVGLDRHINTNAKNGCRFYSYECPFCNYVAFDEQYLDFDPEYFMYASQNVKGR